MWTIRFVERCLLCFSLMKTFADFFPFFLFLLCIRLYERRRQIGRFFGPETLCCVSCDSVPSACPRLWPGITTFLASSPPGRV
jgi:hypothetical protein